VNVAALTLLSKIIFLFGIDLLETDVEVILCSTYSSFRNILYECVSLVFDCTYYM